jgi:hypothetical protein
MTHLSPASPDLRSELHVTQHVRQRVRQRGLREKDLDVLLRYGSQLGDMIVLTRKDARVRRHRSEGRR